MSNLRRTMPWTPSRDPLRGGVLIRLLGLLVVLLLGLVVAIRAGFGSTATEDVRRETLAIPKNAPFAAALKEVVLDRTGETVYAAHLPAEEASEPPLVLVHGTPDTMGAWEPLLFGEGGLAAALGGTRDVWAIEIIGHGMASAGDGPYPFQRCADFVGAALAALGLEDVVLVGNSYGGEFCWRAALDHPDRIGRLVLIDTSGLPRTEEQFLSEELKMRNWGLAARLGYLINSEDRVASALDPHFDGGADPGRVREVWLGLENRGNWNAMIDLVRDENGGRAGELGDLTQPTLLIFGEHDEAYPPSEFGAEFERRIPEARLEVVEGAGHYPHEQDPARVAELLLGFLSEEAEGPR